MGGLGKLQIRRSALHPRLYASRRIVLRFLGVDDGRDARSVKRSIQYVLGFFFALAFTGAIRRNVVFSLPVPGFSCIVTGNRQAYAMSWMGFAISNVGS